MRIESLCTLYRYIIQTEGTLRQLTSVICTSISLWWQPATDPVPRAGATIGN